MNDIIICMPTLQIRLYCEIDTIALYDMAKLIHFLLIFLEDGLTNVLSPQWEYLCQWQLHLESDPSKEQAHIDGLVQDCSNSSASAMELLQSCTEPSIYCVQTSAPYWPNFNFVHNGACHLVAIVGTSFLAHSHPRQVAATQLKIRLAEWRSGSVSALPCERPGFASRTRLREIIPANNCTMQGQNNWGNWGSPGVMKLWVAWEVLRWLMKFRELCNGGFHPKLVTPPYHGFLNVNTPPNSQNSKRH